LHSNPAKINTSTTR